MQDIKNKIHFTSQIPMLDNAFSKELPSQTSFNKNKQRDGKLKSAEKRFQAFVEHSSDIIVLVNLKGIISYINPAVENVLGFKPEERIGASGFELVHPDDRAFLAEAFNTLVQDIKTHVIHGEMRLRHKDGSWRTLEATGSKLVSNATVEAIIVNYRDITDRKQVEKSLKDSEEKFAGCFLKSPIPMAISVIKDGRYIDVNESFAKVMGLQREELIGNTSIGAGYITAEQRAIFLDEYRQKGFVENLELPIRVKGGDLRYGLFNSSKFTIGEEDLFLTQVIDITERKRLEDTLQESEKRYRELSIIDDLTQLYNSRHFYAQLKREIDMSNRYGQPLTLLLLDLDEFKAFNDAYGHVEGDYVLSRFGQVIKQCLRETDSAYRYGGEEFTIMLPVTTCKEAIVTAKRIQNKFRRENFSPMPGKNVQVTVSIGLGQYKKKEEMKAFVHRVDQIMYEAKKSGRDRICF